MNTYIYLSHYLYLLTSPSPLRCLWVLGQLRIRLIITVIIMDLAQHVVMLRMVGIVRIRRREQALLVGKKQGRVICSSEKNKGV